MDDRDHYGRRPYPRERFERDRQTRTMEDEELRYGYGDRLRHEHLPPRRGEQRDLWGMAEGPYSGADYVDEPYGPAHSPAHMRGAREELGWRAGGGWGRPAAPADRPWHDDRSFGGFAGRGPKGYRRSRERILDDVAEGLTRHPEIDASEIELDVQGDVVVLRGRVDDRRQKRTAEDVAEAVSGVRDVRNELEVEKGILETLTDAVTGRSDEERTERTPATPHGTSY